MSFIRNSLITAAAFGVVACGQTSTPAVKGVDNAGEKAFFTALASDKLVVTPPSEAPDIASAFDSLPNGFRVEMGDITINPKLLILRSFIRLRTLMSACAQRRLSSGTLTQARWATASKVRTLISR